MAAQGKVSGRVVVVVLFTSALLMWGIVFLVGLRTRSQQRPVDAGAAADSAVTADEVRAWMKALPEAWVKVSQVEGQGWVLYVPCYSPNTSLKLRTVTDSLPGLACEYCDSLDSYEIKGITRTRSDSIWDLRMHPSAGTIRILPVNDSLLKRFPDAPFQEKILLWTRPRDGGRIDSMVFVPKSRETEFETLRAEDENPEGCGGADAADSTGGVPDSASTMAD